MIFDTISFMFCSIRPKWYRSVKLAIAVGWESSCFIKTELVVEDSVVYSKMHFWPVVRGWSFNCVLENALTARN